MELRNRIVPRAPKTPAQGPETNVTSWWQKGHLVYHHFHEVDLYLQDNDFILTGYRMNYTFRESFISVFHLHNEWMNVWTHLLGMCHFAWLVYTSLHADIHSNARWEDRYMIVMVLACATYTLLCSSLFHLHICVNENAFRWFGCLDYSGISALIFGGSAVYAHFILYCDPIAQRSSIILMMLVSLVGIVGPMYPSWRGPKFRVGRAAVYLSSVFASTLPIIYYLSVYGWTALPDWHHNFAIPGTLLMAVQFFVGAFIYSLRIPEKWLPGFFDIFGASHQIWHILVWSATTTLHLCILWVNQALLGFMDWRMEAGQCLQ